MGPRGVRAGAGGAVVGSSMNTPAARIVSLAGALLLASGAAGQETVTIARDNTVIDRSCRVVVPPGMVIEDTDGNGVIHITADGVTVEFAEGSVLRGAEEGTPWDELTGYGVRVHGAENVTLRGLKVHGFKGGVWATDADGLT